MSVRLAIDLGCAVPKGFCAVPLFPEPSTGLAVKVVSSESPDTLSGSLVVLRDTPAARVYLGALCDSSGTVHEWVEIWVQRFDGLVHAVDAYRSALTNHVLDRDWAQTIEAAAATDARQAIRTGYENRPAPPIFIDIARRKPIVPRPSGFEHDLELCTDDALLREMGLDAYSTTLSRYLWTPPLGLESPFFAATEATPVSGVAAPFDGACDLPSSAVPLNPGGGRLAIRPFAPLSYEQFIDILAGATWNAPLHGRLPVPFEPSQADEGEDWYETGLFLGRHGRRGRVVEGLHLKLRAFASAVQAVADLTRRTQRPLLNLSAESFRVQLSATGVGLPSFWASRVTLTTPGDGAELPIESSDARYFISPDPRAGGVYRPDFGHAAWKGRAAVRFRKVTAGPTGGLTVEGTFSVLDRIAPARNDLVAVSLNLGGERVELYARLESEKALAAGEWRLRSIEQRFSAQAEQSLRASEGVQLSELPFEVIPLITSPCDLYALGVLGVRTLLVNKSTTLAVAIDEVLSLARQVAESHSPDTPLADRIGAITATDPRWLNSLGPHRLVHDDMTPAEAMNLVPPELWREVLALLVSMFPGIGPDSCCRDFGDARPGGLHAVYEECLTSLRLLLVRTRSLMLIDWSYNREISGLIRRSMLGDQAAPAQPRPGPTSPPPTLRAAPAGPPPPDRRPAPPPPRR
ncbi:MAG: hypothetical protein KF866_11695 [Phycisphaeraceae bacterium]|nr:hypothetical protein [Phycisphaeraceae bacterium]MCW5755197.1 hypothetical protein [Phycisphaeraceae bacterium]